MKAQDSLWPIGVQRRGLDYQYSWTIHRLTDPNLEPVTTAEAKSHMRVDISDDDSLIDGLVTAAREWVEEYTGRALIDQTWQMRFEGHSFDSFLLRRSPVIAIDSFYYDVDGVQTLLAASTYELDGGSTKWPRVILANGQVWPATFWDRPLTIQFRAGYADRSASPTEGAEKVPAVFKHAIKMIVGHLYENRESVADARLAELPMGVQWLLNPQRIETGFA